MNHLVVTADDFGLAPVVNQAIEAAHRSGILSATSLMVGSPAAADAVRRARAMPTLRVGLHIVLVEAKPVLPPEQVPDLIGADGYFRTDMARFGLDIALRPRVRRQIRAEITAQYEAYKATGLPLDHVNSHRHFHLHPFVAKEIIAIGKSYGLRALRVPFEPALKGEGGGVMRKMAALFIVPWTAWLRMQAKRAGLVTPDVVFGLRWSGAMTTERVVALLNDLPARNVVEIYTHPAAENSFPGCAPGYRYRDEMAALMAADSMAAFKRSGFSLGGFSDVPAP